MPKKTHKQRAKELLESLGWTVDDGERRIAPKVVKDLFGFIDLLSIRGEKTLALQVTDPTNVAKRVAKMMAEFNVVRCLRAGWIVEAWGIRDKPARDGSLALTRTFELTAAGELVAFADSVVLQPSRRTNPQPSN